MVDVISDLKSTPDRCLSDQRAVWELGLSGKPSTEVTVVYFIMSNVDAWFVEPGGGRIRTIRKDFTVQGRRSAIVTTCSAERSAGLSLSAPRS